MARNSTTQTTRRRKPTRPTPKPRQVRQIATTPVDPAAVFLVRTKGSPGRGGDPGGESWRIDADGKRAGIIFINLIDEPPIGVHPSVQIYLNTASQGRRIGRIAYRRACEESAYDQIFAHMRKSNIASRRAAEEAGFIDVTPPGHIQLIMQWQRPSK